ncbi:hypothetical protein T265_06699 [Opisthorchis viverrini]|uniref:Uncharacterized protein n=1 Tax=Opisthorchis viverrini TaxID=6198 RepID=A0A074ZFI3_OPIVI|nr:hypothetical protein T265_06699 [Opisthorchis viverrini]KER25948.1 hypothetical protein T265_06699 [Opisthorchis viverrini]
MPTVTEIRSSDESSSGEPDQTIGRIAAYSSEADDYSVWLKQTVDCAVSLLESHADSSLADVDLLAFARGLRSGIMTPEHDTCRFWTSTPPGRFDTPGKLYPDTAIRRAKYAIIQTLYHQSRKDATSAVLDGSWKDPYKGNYGVPLDAERYLKQVPSAPKHVDSGPTCVVCRSIESITGLEVGRTIRLIDNSVLGLYELTPKMLRRFNANALARYFNLLLLSGGCPPNLCSARCTLVPEVPNPISPNQLRLISLTSILVPFLQVPADRWSRRLQVPSLQFALLHRDGCLEATSLLHALLRHSSATASKLSLAFVDIFKAFDSVLHDTIVRSAETFGAPSPLVRYIAKSYLNAVAVFRGSLPQRCEARGSTLPIIIHYDNG